MIIENPKFQHAKTIYKKYEDAEVANLSRTQLLEIVWALRDTITVIEEKELEPYMNFPKNWGTVIVIGRDAYSRTYDHSSAVWIDEGFDGYTDREIGMLITRNDYKFQVKWKGISDNE